MEGRGKGPSLRQQAATETSWWAPLEHMEQAGDLWGLGTLPGLSGLVEQCVPWLSHITLLVRVDGQRRMVEISLSGATGGGRVYGPWHGLRHRHYPKGVGKQLLPMTSGTAPALDPGEGEAEWPIYSTTPESVG